MALTYLLAKRGIRFGKGRIVAAKQLLIYDVPSATRANEDLKRLRFLTASLFLTNELTPAQGIRSPNYRNSRHVGRVYRTRHQDCTTEPGTRKDCLSNGKPTADPVDTTDKKDFFPSRQLRTRMF